MMALGRQTRRARDAGLTLLEVLAAVMIFAMVMTVLIGTSSNAVHHIGSSVRRLEADLVADSLLADLEMQIKQGLAPTIEDGDFESEPYAIRMSMQDLIPVGPGGGAGQRAAVAGVGGAPSQDVTALLSASLPEVAQHLRQYDIEVSWAENGRRQRVRRTTYSFDWNAAQGQLASLIEDAAGSDLSGLNGGGAEGDEANESGGGGNGPIGRTGSGAAFNGRNARDRQLGIRAEKQQQ